MTFNEVFIKNFRGNIKNYISYFLCSSFLIMIFFMYSTLLFNDKLNNSKEIEKGVIDAVMVPNVALIAFSIFFISYAHSTFVKSRKKEFGIFMNLGMSIWDIRKIILLENVLVLLASMILGLTSGTIFSRLFFLLITRAINVTGVPFYIGLKNYTFSIEVFIGIFAFAMLTTIISTSKFEIIYLLKGDRTPEKNKIASPYLAVLGIGILVISLVNLYMKFGDDPSEDGGLLLRNTVFCIIGLYITISQLGTLILSVAKRYPKIYYKNLLFITTLNHKFKQTKKIIFTISIMVLITIFYSGFCLSLSLTSEKNAGVLNPYDIAFVQTDNKNNISGEQINNIINSSKNPVIEHKSIEFINYFDKLKGNTREIIISDEEINEKTNNNFNVIKGSYIRLFQIYDINEEEKAKFLISNFSYEAKGKIYDFNAQGKEFKIVFNDLNYFSREFIILNREDYKKLKSESENIEIGNIQLINFKDWKKTKEIVTKLDEGMMSYNETTPKIDIRSYSNRIMAVEDFFKVASKIEAYNYNKQGGALMFYLVTFIGSFFFIATCVILFLKLFSENENDKKKYKKLYKIGITEEEIRKNISKELNVLYFTAPVMGIVGAVVYTMVLFKDSGMVFEGLRSCLLISGIYLSFQAFYYFISKRIYGNAIIESLD